MRVVVRRCFINAVVVLSDLKRSAPLRSGEVQQMDAHRCPAAFNQIGLKADVN